MACDMAQDEVTLFQHRVRKRERGAAGSLFLSSNETMTERDDFLSAFWVQLHKPAINKAMRDIQGGEMRVLGV